MHNLSPSQVHELLQMLAIGIKDYRLGNPVQDIDKVIRWMAQNAPEYLN